MGMYSNKNRVEAFRQKNEELYPKTGKRQSYLRSLVLIFVLLAIAATVNDLRRPGADQAQVAFTELVYQQMEAQKADFWLGSLTAKDLLAQDGWITAVDSDPDVRRVAANLLGLPSDSFQQAPVNGWSGLKLEEAARLWDLWQQQPEGQSQQDFISSQLALAQQDKTLPGLADDLMVLDGRYLLAFDGNLAGICPLSDLKHLD